MCKINDNVIIPLRRHIRYGQFYTVRIGARDIHVSRKLDGFGGQFVKPCVPCGIVREFHDIMIIIVPVHATQLYYRVWRPNIVIENVAILLIHMRVGTGKRCRVLQMWKIHISRLSYTNRGTGFFRCPDSNIPRFYFSAGGLTSAAGLLACTTFIV